MKTIDYIAIFGALAWTPHLIILLKSWFFKSRVRIITQKNVQIGFTTFGPIFNLRLAFAVEHKDIVVSDIKVRVRHESGEEKIFEWQGITQHLGTMKTPNVGDMPYEKEQSVLAIKLNQKEIEERFIRFQDPIFIQEQRDLIDKSVKKLAYLQSEKKYEPEEFLRAEEMTDLYTFNNQAFTWKSGRYHTTIEIQSPEGFTLVDNEREFSLSPIDIERLEKNKEQLELDYKGIIVGYEDGQDNAVWQWCSPSLVKT